MQHIIAYKGLVHVSLGIVQEEYGAEYLPWPNKRIGIEGTLQRPPYTPQNWQDWVRSHSTSKGKDEVFAVLEHTKTEGSEGCRYIGHTGIHGITWPDGRAKTGSVLGADHSQARGYGTEAKLLLQYHAIMVLGLRKLTSVVKGWNAQSLGHLIKCGYRICGRHKEQLFHDGKYVDEIILEVFRADWEPLWDIYQTANQLPKLTPDQKHLIATETKS